jgi:hypothetical protein
MNLLKRRGVWVIILLLAVMALSLRFYMMTASSSYIPVTADESITIMQAKEIASGHPKLFVWAQPYQFPMETFMVSPIVNLLPRNGLGARFHSFFISFLSMIATLLVFFKMKPLSRSWVGMILVLFPSSYLLMIQSGYPHPHYTPAFLFWWIAILAVLYLKPEFSVRKILLLGIAGFFCGLAFTNNMISVAIVVPIAIVACFGTRPKQLLMNVPLFGLGVFCGLLPYLAGIWRYPDAQAPVAGVRPVGEVLARIWPALTQTLPRTMGIDTCLIPDSHHTLNSGVWMMKPFAVLFVLLLVYTTYRSLQRVVRDIKGREWPALAVEDIFVGTSWLGLTLFILSARADNDSFRYLSPVAWSFPFIVFYAYDGLNKKVRVGLASLLAFLVLYNIYSSILLIEQWKEPDYAEDIVNAPDLEPSFEFLRAEGFEHCVASHWAAYRINFLTDEEIICSQPINERFHQWFVPYKEEVDASSKVAYVLTEEIRFLKPHIFEREMKTMKVTSKHVTKGRFEIYYDFKKEYGEGDTLIPFDEMKTTASDSSASAGNMIDGNQETCWSSGKAQDKKMWVQVDFDKPLRVSRLQVCYGLFNYTYPIRLVIEQKTSEGWKVLEHETFGAELDKFTYRNKHPVYSPHNYKTYFFETEETQSLRVRVEEPNPEYEWTIYGLELYKNQ